MALMPDQFWALTYAEFLVMAKGCGNRKTERINELLYLAWHTEAFARQKKLPGLKDLMQSAEQKAAPRREQTPEEMMAMCRLLNAAFGGEVVET